MSNHLVGEALEILHRHGIAGEVHNGGRHYKLEFRNRFGKRCLLVISRSPSNRRAGKNNRAELRRLMRTH